MDGFAVCRLIELSAMLRDLDAVNHWCFKLSQLPNGEVSAIAFKARSLVQCNQYQNAKTIILEGVRKYPNEPNILIACGDIMMVYPGIEMAMANAVQVYQQAVEVLRADASDVARLRDIKERLQEAIKNLALIRGG